MDEYASDFDSYSSGSQTKDRRNLSSHENDEDEESETDQDEDDDQDEDGNDEENGDGYSEEEDEDGRIGSGAREDPVAPPPTATTRASELAEDAVGDHSDTEDSDYAASGVGADRGDGTSLTEGRRRNEDVVTAALRPTRRRLKVCLLKARRAFRRGRGERAVAQFVRAHALARFVHGERHWRTLRCQLLLARVYLDLQELPLQAEEHASEALTTMLMYQGTEDIPDKKIQVVQMQLLGRLVRGQALVQLGQPAVAEESLHKAACILPPYSALLRRTAGGGASAELEDLQLRLYTWRGRAAAARGRLETARENLAPALELLRARGDVRTAAGVARELATLEMRGARRRNAAEAVRWLREAAQLTEQSWGMDSAEHLDCQLALLKAERRLPEPDLAALTEKMCSLQARCSQSLGVSNAMTLKTTDQLIQLHSEQQYYEKAARECRLSTKAKIAAHGELSREVADSLRTLSQLYSRLEDLPRALEVARRWGTIEALMYGKRDRRALAAEEAIRSLEKQQLSRGEGRFRLRSAVSSPPSTSLPSLNSSLRL